MWILWNSNLCEDLDQNPTSDETVAYFFGPEEGEEKISLLYRPGHYDILYKNGIE